MTSLNSLVISWSRTRVQPVRVTDGAGFPRLIQESSYRDAWEDADRQQEWQKPWAGMDGYNNFWGWELGGGYRGASGSKAWKNQVPLRRGPHPQLTLFPGLPGVALDCAQFLYPTGTGAIVTADIRGSYTPTTLLELVARLSNESLVSASGTPPRSMRKVLDALLDDVDLAALGTPDRDGVQAQELRTVAVITEPTEWDQATLQPASELHRLLAGLCLLSPAPMTGAVPDLDAMLMPPRRAKFVDTVRVARGDGQAAVSRTEQPLKKLACYQGNLALASMQASMLLESVRWAWNTGNQPGIGKEAMRLVINILGRKYGRADSVYSSDLIRRQIDDSGLVAAINAHRPPNDPLHPHG
jgi:hypothetical protein